MKQNQNIEKNKNTFSQSDNTDENPIQTIVKKSRLTAIFKFLIIILSLLSLSYAGLALYFNFINPPEMLSPLGTPGKTLGTYTKLDYEKKIVGFLPFWHVAKRKTIYPKFLDELIYFGITIDKNGNIVKTDDNGDPDPGWSYLNSDYLQSIFEKSRQENVIISLAIISFDNETIDSIISNKLATKNLISQIDKINQEFGFQGLNVDFEYIPKVDFPTRKYFNQFLATLNDHFKAKDPNFVLSVDVYCNAALNDYPYDMKILGLMVDEVIIMGYDFHRSDSITAGPVSPLRGNGQEKNITDTFRAIYNKIPSQKLFLGIPFYGYEWQTTTADYRSQVYPGTGGVASYERIRQLITEEESLYQFWDRITQTPYIVYNQGNIINQIYFENESSLILKMQFIKQLQLGGTAIWALGYEGNYYEPWGAVLTLKDL
jgi:spore germination protein YaaH